MEKYQLKLYITGDTYHSQRAAKNLRRIAKKNLQNYEIEIVDLLKIPEIAAQEHIVATPTLVRQQPLPARRIIGDLSDERRVLFELDIQTGD